jgi:hypothetical protein
LNVANTGKLTFDTTAGPVKLFVNNWLNLTSGSLVQFSGTTPSDVSIFVSASGFHDRDGDGIKDLAARFLCSPPFYGSLYAPGANVTLPPGFEFFGAISAQKLTFNEGARVHFDVALEALNAETEGSVEKLSWRVIEIPVAIARSFDESPFELLGVVEGSLDAPVDAHPDPGFLIHIMYRDLGDTLLSYRGPEAAFDWSNVKSVVQIVRTLP